mgnify:CR=1 FL=1
MKTSHALLLLAGLLSITMGVQARRPVLSPEVLAIVTSYDFPPSEGMVRELHNEMQAIFKIEAARLAWRDFSQLDYNEAFDHLVIARFSGHCEMLSDRVPERLRHALGFTHVSDGKVLPFLEIDCDRVAALLGPANSWEPLARRELLFGRALARVLGHEMYHVIAETQEHNKYGLAKPALTAKELTADRLAFEQRDLDRIEEKIQESMPGVMTR